MRGAPISPSRFSALPARPARGGSTTTTSGSPARCRRSLSTSPTLPAKNAVLPIAVQLLVLDRAGDRLLADLDPPHRHRLSGHREADRADAAVEVVDRLAAGQRGELARDRVQLRGHLGVRLQERVRADAEAQAVDLLLDRVVAPEQLGRQVRHLGDARVHRPVDRLDRGDRGQHLDQALAVEALAAARHELDEHLAGVAALADEQVAQVALVRLLVVREQLLLARPVAHGVADRVAGVARQPALLDLEHLVPAARLVQAERRPVLRLRERVLHLVAVVELRRRRDDRIERRVGQAGEALQRVGDPLVPSSRPARRRRGPGSGSRRRRDSARTARRRAAGRA